MDFWISKWISGFQSGFLDFKVDFRISSRFQSGFLDFVWTSIILKIQLKYTHEQSINHIPLSLDANRYTMSQALHRYPAHRQCVGWLSYIYMPYYVFVDCHTYTCAYCVLVDCHTYTCHTTCSLIVILIHAHTVCSLIVIYIHAHTACLLIVIHIHAHTVCSLTSLSYIIHLTIAITSPRKNDLSTRPKIGQVQRSFVVVMFYYVRHRKSVHVHIHVNPVM